MSDLNYRITADVSGVENVQNLKDEIAGVDEAATGIGESGASAEIEDIGRASEGAAGFGDKAATAFSNMVAAIGLVEIATAGAEVAIGAVRDRLEAMSRIDAWEEEQVEGYKDAVLELGEGLGAIEEHLRNVAGQNFEQLTGLFGLGGGSNLENPAASFGALGVTIGEVMDVVRGGEPELEAMRDRLEEIGIGGDVTRSQMRFLEDQQASYHAGVAEGAQELVFYSESQESANRALQDMLTNRNPMGQFTDEWALLRESMSDGSIDTTAAAEALNTLKGELGLTTEQVLELAQADLDRAAEGAQAFADAINSVEFDATELEAATTAFSQFSADQFEAGNRIQSTEEAYRNFVNAVGDGALNLDTATEAGAAQQDALEDIASVLDGQLAQAYDNANGSQADFIAAATQIGDETLARLQSELDLTDEQVNTLRETLGLTAVDYAARFELAGVQEAQLQLGLLQGALDGLPPDVQQEVNLLVIQGDYIGARDAIAQYYNDNPVPATVVPEFKPIDFADQDKQAFIADVEAMVTIEPDTAPVDDAITDITTTEHSATITLEPDTTPATAGISDVVNADYEATVTLLADTAAAVARLIQVANADYQATIDAAVGSVPSASEFVRRVGPIRVPIQAYWNNRVEGTRPR